MSNGHTSLTVLDAQDAVCKRLEEIFSGTTYNSAAGVRKPVGIYPQDLPVPQGSDDDADSDPTVTAIPYIIARLTEGKVEGDDNTVLILLVFGAYDQANDRSGYRDIVSMIQRIIASVKAKPYIDKNFEVHRDDIQWAINQEDTSPFNFGAMQLTLSVPSYNQEPDDLA
jgi:hypothetical protein